MVTAGLALSWTRRLFGAIGDDLRGLRAAIRGRQALRHGLHTYNVGLPGGKRRAGSRGPQAESYGPRQPLGSTVSRGQGDVRQPRLPLRGLRGSSERRELPTTTVGRGPTLATVSQSDDHWLGRVVLTIGVAMSSATVALLMLLLIGGR